MSVVAPSPWLARPAQWLRIGASGLWHERWLALCAACTLAAALAPLWILWGLAQGMIGALLERQNADPAMRLVVPSSSASRTFDAAWFARVAAWHGVSFVIPSARLLAAQADLYSDTAAAPLLVDLRPTARGDPLLGDRPAPGPHALLLSAPAARRLNAAAGGTLKMALRRTLDGRDENALVTLRVEGVLPLAASGNVEALADRSLVESMEAWRDGHRVEGFGDTGQGPPPAWTASPYFRLYATAIQQVPSLVARLEGEGLSTESSVREIEATLGLQRRLHHVIAMVGIVVVAGAVIALLALQAAGVRRKRREHAMLVLTGYGRGWLLALPCLDALAVAAAGALLALALYAAGAHAVEGYFAGELRAGEAAVRLHAGDVAAGFGAAVLVSLLAALWGGWRAARMETADELREP